MNAAPSKRESILEVLRFVERWRSREEMERHIRSDRYLRILAAMELSSERPEISFHAVSETKGLELIEGLRT